MRIAKQSDQILQCLKISKLRGPTLGVGLSTVVAVYTHARWTQKHKSLRSWCGLTEIGEWGTAQHSLDVYRMLQVSFGREFQTPDLVIDLCAVIASQTAPTTQTFVFLRPPCVCVDRHYSLQVSDLSVLRFSNISIFEWIVSRSSRCRFTLNQMGT